MVSTVGWSNAITPGDVLVDLLKGYGKTVGNQSRGR